MKETVIVTTKEEIEQIFHELFDKMINKFFRNEKKETEDAPLMLTIEQASRLTGLAVATIYTKTSNRQIPFHKKGKKLRFLRSELEQWLLEDSRVRTGSELESEAANYCLENPAN